MEGFLSARRSATVFAQICFIKSSEHLSQLGVREKAKGLPVARKALNGWPALIFAPVSYSLLCSLWPPRVLAHAVLSSHRAVQVTHSSFSHLLQVFFQVSPSQGVLLPLSFGKIQYLFCWFFYRSYHSLTKWLNFHFTICVPWLECVPGFLSTFVRSSKSST